MDAVLWVMLVRFGIMAGIVLLVGLVLAGLVLLLRRGGRRVEGARRGAATLARGASEHLSDAQGVRGRAAGAVARTVAGRLDEP